MNSYLEFNTVHCSISNVRCYFYHHLPAPVAQSTYSAEAGRMRGNLPKPFFRLNRSIFFIFSSPPCTFFSVPLCREPYLFTAALSFLFSRCHATIHLQPASRLKQQITVWALFVSATSKRLFLIQALSLLLPQCPGALIVFAFAWPLLCMAAKKQTRKTNTKS